VCLCVYASVRFFSLSYVFVRISQSFRLSLCLCVYGSETRRRVFVEFCVCYVCMRVCECVCMCVYTSVCVTYECVCVCGRQQIATAMLLLLLHAAIAAGCAIVAE